MNSDSTGHENIGTRELNAMRQKAARSDRMEAELADLRQKINGLERQLSERETCAQLAAAEQTRVEGALRTAQVIIENSPVILFRRHSEGDRQLVYVSDNIRQFGYAPDDFLKGGHHWRDLVHPDDVGP